MCLDWLVIFVIMRCFTTLRCQRALSQLPPISLSLIVLLSVTVMGAYILTAPIDRHVLQPVPLGQFDAESQIIKRLDDAKSKLSRNKQYYYPKHASDDLTRFVLTTKQDCPGHLDAVIIVHSSVKNFHKRNLLRSYADYKYTQPYRVKIVFLMGQSSEASQNRAIVDENKHYGDTVVGPFMDTYHNLTLKAVMGFRWVAEKCNKASVVIKIDDDVFIDIQAFFKYWRAHGKDLKRSILCHRINHAFVLRRGKWGVSESVWPNETWGCNYCGGMFAILTPDLITDMYSTAKRLDFFWIDDVFMYGFVVKALRGDCKLRDIRHMLHRCSKTDPTCHAIAHLTKNSTDLEKTIDKKYRPEKGFSSD